MMKARYWPSGDQLTAWMGSLKEVTCRGNPPSRGMVQICGTPVRVATNASWVPSGEMLGDQTAPTWAIDVTVASTALAVSSPKTGTASMEIITVARSHDFTLDIRCSPFVQP